MWQDRDSIRQTFITAWQKAEQQLALTDLEQQLVDVILLHPEYHELFNTESDILTQAYTTDTNPFLHMALHLSLREQLIIESPPEIKTIFEKLSTQYKDPHRAEHLMMDALANTLWDAQQHNQIPSLMDYLEKLRKL